MNWRFTSRSLLLAAFLSFTLSSAWADVINSHISYLTRTGYAQTQVVDNAQIGYLNAYQHASINVSGGTVSWLSLYDNSTAAVSGGDISWLSLYNNSTATVSGGDISWLRLFGNNNVTLTGLEDLSWLVISNPSAHVNIFANDVQYVGNQLSGYWGNGDYFSFWAVDGNYATLSPASFSIFAASTAAVPEPSAALLFSLGLAVIYTVGRNRKQIA